VPSDIIWSLDQKELIDTVEHYLNQLQDWRNAGSSAKHLPTAPKILVLGGPGNGKTTALSRIAELYAEYNFPLLSSTMTGMPHVIQHILLLLADNSLM
jgi:predicted NACHT family NTPase